jgi:hypothetical protein
MTGGAIFAVTAWLTLAGMWIGGGVADRLLDGAHKHAPAPAPSAQPAAGAASAPTAAP